jgi:D-alanine transaminase
MEKISYVNGHYVPHAQASVHIEDRGYQFSDGIYEVIAIKNNRMIDGEPHLVRLARSLKEMDIHFTTTHAALKQIIRELMRRNGKKDGCLYLQITRGVAKRAHEFPKSARPSLVMTVSDLKFPGEALQQKGVAVITHPDIRWGRRDIKTISLLPNILAKQKATCANVREAWLVKDGNITEGSSSNSYIIDKNNKIITHPATNDILNGITRVTLLRLAKEAGIAVEERPFTVEEAKNAREAFLTSTTSTVLPVVKIDDTVLSDGTPQPITKQLSALYTAYMNL